jgi:hypothetical protein
MVKFDQEVERLYGLPIEEFVAARNELSRRLKSEGDTNAADEVKQLVKPSVAAWTINQLSRRHGGSMRALLEAAVKLQKAQKEALQSRGSGEALRRAQAEERAALRELTERAEQILEASGRAASSTVLNRVSSTLRAAAVSDAGRTGLKTGRLAGEVKSSGFDAVAELELSGANAPRKSPAGDDLAERRRQKEERQRKRRSLKERARKLAALATDQERQAEQAERVADEARTRAEKSRLEAEEATADLEELDAD